MISKGIKKLKGVTFYMVVGAIVALALTNLPRESSAPPAEVDEGIAARVVEIVDGDTVKVFTSSDGKLTVRLLGIDTPELETSLRARREGVADCLAVEASAALSGLIAGKDIKLELDTNKDSYDKYGRMLAYIFVDGANINQQMIEQGYAYEYTYRAEQYKYQKQFKSAQKQAEAKRVGLWAPGACE